MPTDNASRGWPARLDALWSGPAWTGTAAAVRAGLALASPTDCVGCSAPDTVLCPRCRSAIRAATIRPFRAEDAAEALPLVGGSVPLPAVAAGSYRNELAAALLGFKNSQRVGLAGVLGPALAGALQAAAPLAGTAAPVLVVPVPSTAAALARRGYAPVAVLLRWVSRRGLLPPQFHAADVLRVTGAPFLHSGGQKARGRRARARAGSRMSLRPRIWPGPAGWGDPAAALRGRVCVVVDDVLTTGATAAAASRALESAGARVAAVVVVAATPAPRGPEATPATRAKAAPPFR